MRKIDLKKDLKHLYKPSARKVVQVVAPTLTYLMIDGEGDPNTSAAFTDAVQALFSVSYTTKFMVKRGDSPVDYAVMPLEGLWWADDMSQFSISNKSNWKWTLMMLQPPFVTRATIEKAMAEVANKKNLAAIAKLRVEELTEGPCAQILHIGPFSAEGPTIEKVHQFIGAQGKLTGKHHEIYLSDIRKADPAKWKTIIRQPFQPG